MDARTLSYINLYGILGTLPELCHLSPEAQAYLRGQTVRVGITVKNGPSATLSFAKSQCTLEEGTHNCQILLPFSSPERFNGMIDGTVWVAGAICWQAVAVAVAVGLLMWKTNLSVPVLIAIAAAMGLAMF